MINLAGIALSTKHYSSRCPPENPRQRSPCHQRPLALERAQLSSLAAAPTSRRPLSGS
jgi:hypothetical protein